jgi:hypothetical protein
VQATIARAIALNPEERFHDMMELALEMEAGPSASPSSAPRPLTFYERSPVQFWQGVSALLAGALILSFVLRH